jgi:hypothetical protein
MSTLSANGQVALEKKKDKKRTNLRALGMVKLT